jgi:oligopeptide transport system substrate-binding protein
MTRNQWILAIGGFLVVSILAVACVAFLAVGMLSDRGADTTASGPAAEPEAAVTVEVAPESETQQEGESGAPAPAEGQAPAAEQPAPTESQASGERREGGTLRLVGPDPTTLDPHLVTDVSSAEYVVEIFSGLVTLTPDLEVVPDLAERWEIDDSGTVYTFFLRQDAQFHDGKPVTAQDFKWSLERAADPDTRSPVASVYLNDIVGAMDKIQGRADEIEGVKVIDDHTLEITIDAPKAYFLAKLTYSTAFVLDRENVESGGSTWTDQPNGTGPFRLREYRLGEEIVLERNPFYHGEPKPAVQRVTYQLAGGSPMIMYESGDIDATTIGLADIERVLDPTEPLNQELTVVAPTLSTTYIGLNTESPPFDDVKVRQALNYAIDKQLLADVVLRRAVVPAEGILPPRMPGYNPDLNVYDFDLDRAKELIAESKYGSVEGLPDITLTTSGAGAEGGPVSTAVVGMLQQNLGLEVSIELVESAVFLSDVDEGMYQMFAIGWSADYPDPQDFLDLLFYSQSATNHTHYANPEVDRLVEEARVEPDHDRRMEMYQEIEQMILEDAPWIPLLHGAEYWLTKPYVHGMVYPPSIVPRLKYVWLEQ